jgi:hypothetical protein
MFLASKNAFILFFKRSAVFGFTGAGLFCIFSLCSSLSAQRAGGEKPSRFMERIDAEEGALRLENFRRQRLDGDFCFEFELEYKPRRAPTVRYQGIMWGTWNELGPLTRFRVYPKASEAQMPRDARQAVELIVQNGIHPEAWIRPSGEDAFYKLEGEALFEPILPGLLYAPFDLQMPFIYWENFTYEGPDLVGATRVAQQFLMLPPEGSASAERGIGGVRIGLDDTYNALWRIEVMDTSGNVASRFSVESFRKVQKQYIVKRITLTEYPSKDRTTFEVEAAAVGLSLKRELFDPYADSDLPMPVPRAMDKL